jgi:hypothetical protein
VIALQSIKLELPPFFILRDCNKLLFLKGGNSNLIDCNAIAQYKKGRQLQFNRLQCNHEQIKKGDNSNLIDCNAIAQNKKHDCIAIY